MTTTDPSYAVVFKTHFWDAFAERQYGRLCACAGAEHVYISIDETNRAHPDIRHDRILRISEAMLRDQGYAVHSPGPLFWRNADYPLYPFIDRFPRYEYVVLAEYDCFVAMDVRELVRRMARDDLAFVGEPIVTPLDEWPWSGTVAPYYPRGFDYTPRLLCFSGYSRAFARALQAARREQGARVTADAETGAAIWPFGEGFVGAEIARGAWRDAPLAGFADVSRYAWAPAQPEFAFADAAAPLVAHPVLDRELFIAALAKAHWAAEDLFEPGSPLGRAMAAHDPAQVVALFLRPFAADASGAALDRLRNYARERGANAPEIWNVARGKPATQSSTCQWSRRPGLRQDAAGAVDGRVSGRYGFHTGEDVEPWWCVDLEACYPVREIRIHNRSDVAERARGFVVSGSTDMAVWRRFGGDDGTRDLAGPPLRFAFAEPIRTRFIRVSLPGRQYLHLDEVEVFI